MRHILIAVCGRTPQIITETVWALTQQRSVALSEIHVVTTLEGLQAVQEHLLDPDHGQFWQFCREYGITPDSVRFSKDGSVPCWHVV